MFFLFCFVLPCDDASARSNSRVISLVPRCGGGRGKSAWCTLFAHARNYSKRHVVELGACTNVTINGLREQHKPS